MTGKWRGSGENRKKEKKGKEGRRRLRIRGAQERALWGLRREIQVWGEPGTEGIKVNRNPLNPFRDFRNYNFAPIELFASLGKTTDPTHITVENITPVVLFIFDERQTCRLVSCFYPLNLLIIIFFCIEYFLRSKPSNIQKLRTKL